MKQNNKKNTVESVEITQHSNNTQGEFSQGFDSSIFEIDKEKGLVNITKIAKTFGKEVKVWNQRPSTKKFLNAYFAKNPRSQNMTTVSGGDSPQGTWVSRKIALKFAEWISPEFEVFTNELLDELFQTGTVSLNTSNPFTNKTELELLNMTVQKLNIAFQENQKLTLENNDLKVTNKRLIHSTKTYTATEIAKELNFSSAQVFNAKLKEMGVQYKVNQTWVLTSKYSKEGYDEQKQIILESGRIVYDRMWTGPGRDFLLSLFENQLTEI